MAGPAKLNPLIRKARAEGWGDQFITCEADEQAIHEGCWFKPELGQHVCDFFSGILRHFIGEFAGHPFKLHPIQENEIIHPIFSWIREDGTRRIRTVLIYQPKKTGKTALCSGLGLYGLTMDAEPGARIYCAANDREQAGEVYRGSLAMIEAAPELSELLECTPSKKTITLDTSSWMKAISADVKGSQGKNAHYVIIDELHCFDAKGRELYDSLLYAGSMRKQPLFIVISTAGEEEDGIGFEEYQRCEALYKGKQIETSTFAYWKAADREDDPGAETTWEKANPMLDVTISREEMRRTYLATEGSASKLATWKRYKLNVYSLSAEPWLDVDAWDRSGHEWAEEHGITPESLIEYPCGGGLDIGLKNDMTAFARCYPLDDGYFAFLVDFMLPGDDILDREKKDRSPYRDWVADGHMQLTDGKVIDFDRIENLIADHHHNGNMIEVGYDRFFASQTAQRLQDNHGIVMVETSQGFETMSEPTKLFEALIISGKLIHFGHPILRKQVGIVCTKTDGGGRIRPVKSTGRGKVWHKIDGVVACIIAFLRARASAVEGVEQLIV